MKEKIILLIDDDYKKTGGHFFTYSQLIEAANIGCKVLEKDKIQNLLSNLKTNASDFDDQKECFRKWFLEIDKDYEIVAFILDVELETNPFNGISIYNMIKNGEIYPVMNRSTKKFFYTNVPKILFTSKDEVLSKYGNETWVLNKNSLDEKKFSKSLEDEINSYFNNIKENRQQDILDDVYLLLKEINDDVKDIKKNTKLISKMIAKSLPLLTDTKKAKQIIDVWEKDNDFRTIMQDCKIKKPENLFNKLTNLKDKFTDNVKENFAEMIYEEVTQFFESEADIAEEDDRLTKFLKYSTYVVEKIGEVVHKR